MKFQTTCMTIFYWYWYLQHKGNVCNCYILLHVSKGRQLLWLPLFFSTHLDPRKSGLFLQDNVCSLFILEKKQKHLHIFDRDAFPTKRLMPNLGFLDCKASILYVWQYRYRYTTGLNILHLAYYGNDKFKIHKIP